MFAYHRDRTTSVI